jgi:hypothetical protein
MENNYRIIELTVNNFKGIEVIDITPEQDVVKVQGKNDACKTALINSIMVALTGTRGFTDLVKRGEDKAIIEADFGEFVIRRVISQSGTQVQVLAKTMGKRVPMPSPAEFIAEKVNTLALSPLSFTSKSPREQVTELLAAFKVDITDLEMEYLELDKERKTAKDEVKTYEKKIAMLLDLDAIAAKHGLAVKSFSFMEKWDALSHLPELAYAAIPVVEKELALLDTYKSKYASAKEMLQERNAIPGELAEIDAALAKLEQQKVATLQENARKAAAITDKIAKLKAELAALEKELVALQVVDVETLFADERVELAQDKKDLLARKMELDSIDFASAMTKIQAKIDETNQTIMSVSQLQKENARLEQIHTEVAYARKQKDGIQALTEQIDRNKQAQRDRLAAANIPIPGLEIVPEGIMINGALFQNLSESVRIKMALQIVKARDPQIKVITIEAGSGIDSGNMQILTEFAKENGYQIWIEQVREVPTPGEGFYLEAGAVLTEEEKRERLTALLNR